MSNTKDSTKSDHGAIKDVLPVSDGMLLAVLSVVTMGAAFCYELGVASYFEIPIRLIRLSWTVVALALTAVLGTLVWVVGAGVALLDKTPAESEILTSKRVHILTPLVLIMVVLVSHHGWAGLWIGLFSLAVVILIDLSITHWGKFQSKRGLRLVDESQNPLASPINIAVLTLMWTLCLALASGSKGYVDAREKTAFLTTDAAGPHAVLRIYGEIAVLAPLDRRAKQLASARKFITLGSDPGLAFIREQLGTVTKQSPPGTPSE